MNWQPIETAPLSEWIFVSSSDRKDDDAPAAVDIQDVIVSEWWKTVSPRQKELRQVENIRWRLWFTAYNFEPTHWAPILSLPE